MSWSLREVNQPEGCGSGIQLQCYAFDGPGARHRVGRAVPNSAGADIRLPRSYMANSRKHAVESLPSRNQLVFKYLGKSEHVVQLNEVFLDRHGDSILKHGGEIRFRVRESTSHWPHRWRSIRFAGRTQTN